MTKEKTQGDELSAIGPEKVFVSFGPIKLANPHSATSSMLPALSAGGRSVLLASLRMRASTQPKRQKYFFISLFLRLLFAIFNVNHVELVGKAGG